jgi:hypothetical protein
MFSIVELVAAVVFESGPATVLSSDTPHPEKRDVNYIGKLQNKYLFIYFIRGFDYKIKVL